MRYNKKSERKYTVKNNAVVRTECSGNSLAGAINNSSLKTEGFSNAVLTTDQY